jgi:hypothetical protein
MSLLQPVRLSLGVMGLVFAVPFLVSAQTGSGYLTEGLEYAPIGNLPGDQIYPTLALTPNGGILVWQDNITDGDGFGISAQRLDATFSPVFSTFRVNQNGAGDQEHAKVAILGNGGTAIVWQSGPESYQHIYGAFLGTNNTFLNTNGDVPISTSTNYQVNPAITALADGNAIVTWGTFGQDNSDGLQGVYAQIMSTNGQKVGGEFQVNQFTPNNQRTPAVAAFPNGNFIVSWISENERFPAVVTGSDGTMLSGQISVDVYARIFSSNGVPLGNEFLVDTDTNVCADPAVATASDGSFTIVWCAKNVLVQNNSWDVYSRQFDSSTNGGTVQVVNTQLYGDQYDPRISSLGTTYLVAWTSLGQDGSREGVYAQFLQGSTKAGPEFRVNTTTLNAQKFQTLASDGSGRFLAAWSSFIPGPSGMDIYAQRYISATQVLSAPAAPVVSALDSYTLSVTWAPLAGFNVDHWNVYVDGSSSPVTTTDTYWQNQGVGTFENDYNPSSIHTFQISYVLTGGSQSPLSAMASGQTWGPVGRNGLPNNWLTMYWGSNSSNWPTASSIITAGGLQDSAYDLFLSGANPTNAATWLVQKMTTTSQGQFLSWNTQPGYIYQVLTGTPGNWTPLGNQRFAAGTTDSIYLGKTANPSALFRIMRVIY